MLRIIGKMLFVLVGLLEKALLFTLEKTNLFLKKSYNEEKKGKTKVDIFLDKARDMLEQDFLTKSSINIDTYINDKLDEIIFFRELLKEFSFPVKRVEQLKSMENEIFKQLLAYSELQKGNTKAEVALIGGFNSGKSKIINSFLKEEVCPSNPNPTTSSVTKFYFSNNKIITLDGKKISYQEYTEKVRHKNLGKDTKTYFFKYGHSADIFNSIVLYDTPGFGNAANRNDDKVTEEILQDVDVVIYTIDAIKGVLDAEDVKRLKKLKGQKNKKFYCIVNKADEKSPVAIAKIEKEIEKIALFDTVIAYSAKNVLEASTHFSIEKFCESTKKKIYEKSIFESVIKGEIQKGRRNKEYYRLLLDDQSIDDKAINAIIQRDKLGKIFDDIAMQKHHILEKSFTENEKQYKLRAKNLLNDILSEIDTFGEADKKSEIEKELEEARDEIVEFESFRLNAIKIIAKNGYGRSLKPYKVSKTEKSFTFNPYYKIGLSKSLFDEEISELKEIFEEIYIFAKEKLSFIEIKYDISLVYLDIENWKNSNLYESIIDISTALDFKSVGTSYSNYYSDGYTFYYDNKEKAFEKIDSLVKFIDENIDRFFAEAILPSGELYSMNHDTIVKKAGMIDQGEILKNKSKKKVKEKIQNHLKGEKNV